MGNPSSGYACAKQCRDMMADFARELAPKGFRAIFTSGASESNSTAIQSIVNAVARVRKPHVVCSAYEHKSITMCIEALVERGTIACTWVAPDRFGGMLEGFSKVLVPPNKYDLVICMQAQNELGAVNDVELIASLAHDCGAVMHADCVQMFGKYPLRPQHVDSIALSFHKMHGPMGVGAWIVREDLLNGYKLQPIIYGTQNASMRGGTENLPGIAASWSGYKHTMRRRDEKNANMIHLRDRLVEWMHEGREFYTYAEWTEHTVIKRPYAFVLFDPDVALPGVVFFAVVLRDRLACNTELKKSLERRGIIVSVGSACNTASKYASHVLTSMLACKRMKAGALRVSFGDDSTDEDLYRLRAGLEDAIVENITRA